MCLTNGEIFKKNCYIISEICRFKHKLEIANVENALLTHALSILYIS